MPSACTWSTSPRSATRWLRLAWRTHQDAARSSTDVGRLHHQTVGTQGSGQPLVPPQKLVDALRLDARIELRRLELEHQTCRAADRVQHVGQGRDRLAEELRPAPRTSVEPVELGPREPAHPPRCSVGKHPGDVGRPRQRGVVDDHQLAVPGALDVDLDERRLLMDGQLDRRDSVLGRGPGRPAVRDDGHVSDDGSHVRHPGGRL